MIVSAFLRIPEAITIGDMYFELHILSDGLGGLQLTYIIINGGDEDNRWDNPILDKDCDYLISYPGIRNDNELLDAIKKCQAFIVLITRITVITYKRKK